MNWVKTIGGLSMLALLACQESAGPVSPPLAGEVLGGPAALAADCPCWDRAALATAFPLVHFYDATGDAPSLTRFDHANAQQFQALVSLTADGSGACELATYGQAGRIEALAAVENLSAAECVSCASLLAAQAAGHGAVVASATGEAAE